MAWQENTQVQVPQICTVKCPSDQKTNSYFVFTVIADVVHADQHRHHLPVLLEVQTLKQKLRLSLVVNVTQRGKIKWFIIRLTEWLNTETYWVRLECVNHGSNLIWDISVEEQTNTQCWLTLTSLNYERKHIEGTHHGSWSYRRMTKIYWTANIMDKI